MAPRVLVTERRPGPGSDPVAGDRIFKWHHPRHLRGDLEPLPRGCNDVLRTRISVEKPGARASHQLPLGGAIRPVSAPAVRPAVRTAIDAVRGPSARLEPAMDGAVGEGHVVHVL